jgi:hypothetical protein
LPFQSPTAKVVAPGRTQPPAALVGGVGKGREPGGCRRRAPSCRSAVTRPINNSDRRSATLL